MAKKIPQWLQPILCSVKGEQLDLEKDKVRIIHQLLAYGHLKEWRWLVKTYTKETVKEIFIHQPLKIYNSMNFNFVKEILLEISNINLNSKNYVAYIYRRPDENWWRGRSISEKLDPAIFYQKAN